MLSPSPQRDSAMVRRSRTKLTGPVDVSLRDEQANQEVSQILAVLPSDHPGRMKFAAGRPTVELQYLIADLILALSQFCKMT